MPRGLELRLASVDRHILLAQGDQPRAHRVTGRRRLGPTAHRTDNTFRPGWLVAERLTHYAKGPWRVAEPPGDVCRRQPVDELGSQRLVRAVQGLLGGQEEARFGGGLC
jgi:hypothetical protein